MGDAGVCGSFRLSGLTLIVGEGPVAARDAAAPDAGLAESTSMSVAALVLDRVFFYRTKAKPSETVGSSASESKEAFQLKHSMPPSPIIHEE